VGARYPNVSWVRDERYTDNGNILTSAGITSGVDATLYLLKKLFGAGIALETAQKLGYPHTRFLESPDSPTPVDPAAAQFMTGAFNWLKADIGIVLYDGVSEIAIASITDTYPRSLTANVHTIAPERKPVRSRNGLTLVARDDARTAPALDRVLIPGGDDAPGAAQALVVWSQQQLGRPAELIHWSADRVVYPYDATIADIARRDNQAIAEAVAIGLEYPIGHLQLEGPAFPVYLVARPLVLGLLAVALVLWLERRLRVRRSPALAAGAASA
jgi:transcriptional regulator GlxA family with amidase domain